MKALLILIIFVLSSPLIFAKANNNPLDELNPRSPNIKKILKEMDEDYEMTTGKSAHPFGELADQLDSLLRLNCYRNMCPIWADIDKNAQRLYLYVDGALAYTWLVSTGKWGYSTPDFDRHPDGRIYDRYTSTRYPDGDYNGLGNMPYAVFVSGGYAIHGTTRGNWGRLGTKASHGCIRLHPDNAKIFNILTRKNGIFGVWITVN